MFNYYYIFSFLQAVCTFLRGTMGTTELIFTNLTLLEGGETMRKHKVFNFFNISWSLVTCSGTAPKARYRTSAVVKGDKMYVFGGHDGGKHLNDFYEFSFIDRVGDTFRMA
jgi:hypothetical protein